MNQLPDRLNIVGQVERPILEIRPASVRRPGADQEKQGRERGNDSLARINCLPLSRDHLELPRASSFGWFLFAFGIVGQIVAEGVGFEPTVSCPTLDFESSALNRPQPPFQHVFAVAGGQFVSYHLPDPENARIYAQTR